MAASITRLTLYALISSIEDDLRDLVSRYVSDDRLPKKILGDSLFEKLSQRVDDDVSEIEDSLKLEDLMEFSDIGDALQLINRNSKLLPDDLENQIDELHEDFEYLIQIRNRVMHGRPLEYDDLARTTELTEKLLSRHGYWSSLNEICRKLKAEPESVLTKSIPFENEPGVPDNNLPLPDFDETGFIGRREILNNVKRAVLGVYPVITIVGEGGLGKTSLSLKVAYDLLDSNPDAFEAIIFVSAKTSQLTGPEITRIKGAINTSIGLFDAAGCVLNNNDSLDDPLKDLLKLLEDFRTLLIIDNLETVIDENMNAFLSRIPAGSKILITTRIRFGAFEFPVQLEPMSDKEAIKLLRAAAKVRGCEKLVKTSDKILAKFCKRMRNNPLHIKWFVSAVQSGRRPEEVLADEKIFLQFCLSNVFSKISDNSKKLIRTLLALGGSYTVAELAYLTELNQAELLNSIQELTRTNMFFATSSPTSVSYETKYELSQLARSYLSRFYPINKETQREMLKIKRRLISAGEQIVAESQSNLLSARSIHCRSRSDWVIAKYLREALSKIKIEQCEEALELVEKARGLAPDFSEVYRVEAWAYAHSGNVSQAYDSYEKAVELAPDSAVAYQLFGGFLLRDMYDSEHAAEMFCKAMELCPDRPEPRIELARSYLYTREFEKASNVIDDLEAMQKIDEHLQRKLSDVHLQLYTRLADKYFSEHQYVKCKEMLINARNYYESIPHPDRRMRDKLAKLLYFESVLAGHLGADTADGKEAAKFFVWLQHLLFKEQVVRLDKIASAQKELGLSTSGEIARIHGSGRFGFIKQDSGEEIYFRNSEITSLFPEQKPYVGMRVTFKIKFDWKGRQVATDIQCVES